MGDLSEMTRMCHDCPYWEVCEPPYICSITEAKYRWPEKESSGKRITKVNNDG